jgi:hypothetical protein
MFNEKFVLELLIGGAAVTAMAGFQFQMLCTLGTYDFETTRLNNYNSGSHEIFLRYELFKNNDKITTQRFF